MTPSHIELAADSVLGTLLYYYTPQAVVRVQAALLQSGDLGPKGGQRQAVYRAILSLHRDGSSVDPITVEAFLSRHGWLERAGGRAYMDLLRISANPGCLVDHARIVAADGRWRRWLVAWEAGRDAIERQDEEDLFAALGRIRKDGHTELRLVDKGEAA